MTEIDSTSNEAPIGSFDPMCTCGHTRKQHYPKTSPEKFMRENEAELCWVFDGRFFCSCPGFTPIPPVEHTDLSILAEVARILHQHQLETKALQEQVEALRGGAQ